MFQPGPSRPLRNARRAVDTGKTLSFDIAPPLAAAADQREAAQEDGIMVKRSAWIPRLPESAVPPCIDGVLDDAAWSEGVVLEPFVPPRKPSRACYGPDGSPVALWC